MNNKLISNNKEEKNAIDYLISLIIKKCETDNQLKENILNKEEKSIDKCWNFIKNEVRKKAKKGSYGATDEEVLGIAIHYYTEDNIEEPKQEIKTQTIIKPIKEQIKEDLKELKVENKVNKKNKKQNGNQLSLFDFGMDV